jgi:drug/metabolite transporter (DMT)-like permease
MILYQPGGSFSYLGAGMILMSSLCWAAGSLRMRHVQNLDLATMTVCSYAFAAPIIGFLSLLFEDNHVESLYSANWNWIGFILLYQVLAMSYALYLWKELMRRNPVHQLTAFLVMQPLFVVIFGTALLGESLNTNEIIGGVVLLVGVVIIIARKIQKSKKRTEALQRPEQQ